MTLLAHLGNLMLHKKQDTLDVRRKHLIDVIRRRVLDRLVARDAGVVERDIQPAELFHDRGDRFLHGALIRNVSGRGHRSSARFRDLPRYGLKFGHPSSNQGYGSSLPPKCEGDSPTDAASGTCNQGDPAREPFRIVP